MSLAKLGLVQFALERYSDALSSFNRALSVRRGFLPFDHPEMAKLHNNAGAVYHHRGDAVAALKSFTKALDVQRSWIEGTVRREAIVHDGSVVLNNMGWVYLHKDEADMALNVYEEALLLLTSTFRKDRDAVLDMLSNVAYAKSKRGDVGKALQIYEAVLRSRVARGRPKCRGAVATMARMMELYLMEGRRDDAEHCLLAVRDWQKENMLGDNHLAQKKIGEGEDGGGGS